MSTPTNASNGFPENSIEEKNGGVWRSKTERVLVFFNLELENIPKNSMDSQEDK